MKRFFSYGVGIMSLLLLYLAAVYFFAEPNQSKPEKLVAEINNVTENHSATVTNNSTNSIDANPTIYSNQKDRNMDQPISEKLSDETFVVALARNAIGTSITIPNNCKTEIERKDNAVTVTFIYPLPKGTRGPDYYAKVKLDALSGKVISVLSQD